MSATAEAVADFEFGTENLPPTAISQNVGTDTETPLSITLTGNDPEGVPLVFAIVDDPTLGALTGTAPALTYTPDGTVGDDSFTFTVSDGEHTSDPATVSIDVAAVQQNGPPVISAPATVEVTAGTPREIGVTADDPDDDPLEFSLVDDGGGLAALLDRDDGTATITITSAVSDAGSVVEVDVGVSDGDAGDEATIVVTIVAGQEPINRPPEISIEAPNEVDEGTTVTFDASGTTDADGDALTFAWTLVDFGGTPVATGSGATWSYEFDDDFIGAARLLVTDARGESAEAESEIIVNNVAPTVVVDLSGPSSGLTEVVEVDPGATVSMTGSFTDPGADTHQLEVDWGDGATEALSHQSGAFVASHTYQAVGSFTVVVEVCDDDDGCGVAGEGVIVGDSGSSPPTDGSTTTTTTTTTMTTTTTPASAVLPVAILPTTGSDGSGQVTLAIYTVLLGVFLLAFARPGRRRRFGER